MLRKFSQVEEAILLCGGYIALQMISDVAATKVIRIGPVVMDAGIIYSITFTWRDLIHKRFGAAASRLTIIFAAVINVVMAGYFYLVVKMPPDPEWAAIGGQSAWSLIFGIVPRVVIASILAEVVSELIDTEIYGFWERRFAGWPQWTRVAASNFLSLPIDSAIFVSLAFGGVLPVPVLFSIFYWNIVTKSAFTIGSFWMIYLVGGGTRKIVQRQIEPRA
jgi:uncharacterized integral membrane protein (TIGR00697 family)